MASLRGDNLTNKKVVFIGNARTGKTETVKALVTGSSRKFKEDKYIPTMGVEVHKYRGESGILYNIWDCAGQDKYTGLRDGYYLLADIVFVFTGGLETFNPPEYVNHPQKQWVTDAKRVVPDAVLYPVHNVSIDLIRRLLP